MRDSVPSACSSLLTSTFGTGSTDVMEVDQDVAEWLDSLVPEAKAQTSNAPQGQQGGNLNASINNVVVKASPPPHVLGQFIPNGCVSSSIESNCSNNNNNPFIAASVSENLLFSSTLVAEKFGDANFIDDNGDVVTSSVLGQAALFDGDGCCGDGGSPALICLNSPLNDIGL